MHSDSSDGFQQSQLEIFWKGFTILDVIENICDSQEEAKISTLTGVWKKLIPTLMDDFNGGSNYRGNENSKRTRIRSGA